MGNVELNIDDIENVGNITQEVNTDQEIKDAKETKDAMMREEVNQNNQPATVNLEGTPGAEVIGNLKSALFGGFVKILSFLSQGTGSQDIIYIDNGKLNLIKNAGFIYSDLSTMFGENSLEVIDPSKSIKLLNLIKGGDEVVFVKDDASQRYIISNIVDGVPNTSITLSQPDRSITSTVQRPEIGELKYQTEIDINIVDGIQQASKTLESAFLKLEVNTDTFEIISISTSDDIFRQQIAPKAENTKTYRVFNPFPINKPDDLFFEVHVNNGQVWIKTISNIGMVNIDYMELIEEIGDFDTFSL